MKIVSEKFYISLFILLLLLQLYQPSFRLNIIIQLAVLSFCLFTGNNGYSVRFIRQLVPFVILLLLGFCGTLLYRYKVVNILKDIFHFIKPLTGLLIGYILFRRLNNYRQFIRVIVIAGVLSAFVHFYILIFIVHFSTSIEVLREFTRDNFLELFSIYFLVFHKKFEGVPVFSKKLYNWAALGLITISSLLYFSRSMIIIAGVMVLSAYGYTRITARSLKILGVLTLLTGLLFVYLYSANISRDQTGFEGFLYKIKNAPEEIFKTNIDRDNHADLWDHYRAYEANRAIALMKKYPSSFIFGTGYGSLVNLKFNAPLTGEDKGIRYISELHNGVVYVLYKTGIIGLLIYLFALGRWYAYIYKNINFKTVTISAIGLIFLVNTLTINGAYNSRDIIVFILGGFFFFIKPASSVPHTKPAGNAQ